MVHNSHGMNYPYPNCESSHASLKFSCSLGPYFIVHQLSDSLILYFMTIIFFIDVHRLDELFSMITYYY